MSRLLEATRSTRQLAGYPGGEHLAAKEKLLEARCDLLVPAAVQGRVTSRNAGNIQARLVVAVRR